jgi:HK97 family phage major capsid protein
MSKALIKKHEELVTKIEAQRKEHQSLIDKDEPTAEDLVKAKGFVTDINALIKDANELEALIKASGEIQGYKPGADFKITTTNPDPTGATILGTKGEPEKAELVRTKDGEKLVMSTQEGQIFSEKDMLAMAQTSYEDAYRNYLGKGIWDTDKHDRKVLTVGNDGDGGFAVPAMRMAQLIERMAAPNRLAGKVTSIQTSSDIVTWIRNTYNADDIYTSPIRITNTGEIPSSATTHRVTEPELGTVSIDIGTWMMSILLSRNLIDDAMFNVTSWVMGKFAEAVQALHDDKILNGTGVGTDPEGILINPGGQDGSGNPIQPVVVLSSTADNIDVDQLLGMPFALPEQYINNQTTWIMNRASTGKEIAQFVDAEERPLFQLGQTFPNITERAPDMLSGYPITYSAFAPNIGDGLFPLVFGDMSGWYLATRSSFSIQVLRETYAELNQTGLVGKHRFGGTNVEFYRMLIGKSDSS